MAESQTSCIFLLKDADNFGELYYKQNNMNLFRVWKSALWGFISWYLWVWSGFELINQLLMFRTHGLQTWNVVHLVLKGEFKEKRKTPSHISPIESHAMVWLYDELTIVKVGISFLFFHFFLFLTFDKCWCPFLQGDDWDRV